MNDISKSQEKSLTTLIEQYKDLDKNIHIQENYKRTIGRQITDFFELLNINSKDNVRLVEKKNIAKVTIRQIKELLNLETDENYKIFDSIVVGIDIDKTIDNLIYLNGLAKGMAKKIGERLQDLNESKYIELEIGK